MIFMKIFIKIKVRMKWIKFAYCVKYNNKKKLIIAKFAKYA